MADPDRQEAGRRWARAERAGRSPQESVAPWKTLESELLLDHPFARMVEDTVELPNGHRARWVRYADERDGRPRAPIVSAICRDERGRVLVAYQWCLGPQAVVDEFPGGGADPGESLEDAIRRELMEEVSLYPNRLEYIGGFLPHNRKSGVRLELFVATELEHRSLPSDDEELIETEWLDEAEVDARIRDGRFVNSTLLASWAIYRARYPA